MPCWASTQHLHINKQNEVTTPQRARKKEEKKSHKKIPKLILIKPFSCCSLLWHTNALTSKISNLQQCPKMRIWAAARFNVTWIYYFIHEWRWWWSLCVIKPAFYFHIQSESSLMIINKPTNERTGKKYPKQTYRNALLTLTLFTPLTLFHHLRQVTSLIFLSFPSRNSLFVANWGVFIVLFRFFFGRSIKKFPKRKCEESKRKHTK